ncbi:MAG: HlyC/CorC family transporter [Austwickia sp.]|jgi:CBS domain containing-hemolysin-like protein|nr:HlyC/CorC family transporter [Austwickia sp.]MBK8436197.1 HlyC/CorC family transporter [Austwickia sp.]MBK9101878.1 HlyC/CorC family transporter [Austwickia sp.]
MNTATALAVSVLLLVANAFFVAAEFAVIAAKRHRLEEAAAAGDRLARTAVRNARDLSMCLAGAQLGITLCTLGLGALAKPAVASVFATALGAARVPDSIATVVSVLLAVSLVVFLHMVVGEMAPKSWAISDAERSARLLAWPFRAYVVVARPVLAMLNGLANLCLRAVKVTPQDELAQVHGPRELRMLLAASSEHGMLVPDEHRMLAGALAMTETPLRQVALPIEQAVRISPGADAAEIEWVSRQTGRSRLVVMDAEGRALGLVHVLDAIRATTQGRRATAAELQYETTQLPQDVTLVEAIRRMQQERSQLALVVTAVPDPRLRTYGLVALEDLLERILGEFEDERD